MKVPQTPQHNLDRLVEWYLYAKRALPWRQSSNAYSIWVSEVMLQQTQVKTVIGYFERFIERFPDVARLARASESDVLSLWAGLGYYSRARNLHRGARAVASQFGGVIPQSVEELVQIPGIGHYTAGAISSIAFGKRAPIVDGNVKRVFSRFFKIASSIENPPTHRLLWAIATDWVSRAKDPSDINQAMMELGALICTPKNPSCDLCPIRASCAGRANGIHLKLPNKRRTSKPVSLYWTPLVITKNQAIFLEKRSDTKWWKGLWDLPRVEHRSKRAAKIAQFGEQSIRLRPFKHSVTIHRINISPVWFPKGRSACHKGRWFPLKGLESLPTSSLVRKVLQSADLV